MSNENRLSALEIAIAELQLRDARREREHISLLTVYAEQAKAQTALRDEVETTVNLKSEYLDKRLGELIASTEQPNGLSREALLLVAKELSRFMADICRPLVERIAQHDRLLLQMWKLLELLMDVDRARSET